jgi:hypothetical protein
VKQTTSSGQSEAATTCTTEEVKTRIWTENTKLKVRTMEQFIVTFAANSDQSAMGSLETSTTKVDKGKLVKDVSTPTPTLQPGYVVDKWTWTKTVGGTAVATITAGEEATSEATITENVTATVSFKNGTYSISNSGTIEGVEVKYLADNKEVEQVDRGTDLYVNVTIGADKNVEITGLQYKIGEGNAVDVDATALLTTENANAGITKYPLTSGTADQTVVFKIPGENITGDITVIVQYEGAYTVTYKINNEAYGVLKETIAATETKTSITKTYAAGYTLQSSDLPAIAPATGYTYEWDVDPEGKKVETNLEYTVVFKEATYNVTWSNGTGTSYTGPATATYNQDMVFTPSAATGYIVTGVTYTVLGKRDTFYATSNGDGTYTIPGTNIVGALTVSVDTTSATFEFITYSQYQALAGGTKIAVLHVNNNEKFTNKVPVLTETAGRETTKHYFYWSSKYSAYVAIVDNSENPSTLASKLSFEADGTEGNTKVALYTLNCNGDVDGMNGLTIVDAGYIKDVLLSQTNGVGDNSIKYTITEKMRLEMDVCDNSTTIVTAKDYMWIVEDIAGYHKGT